MESIFKVLTTNQHWGLCRGLWALAMGLSQLTTLSYGAQIPVVPQELAEFKARHERIMQGIATDGEGRITRLRADYVNVLEDYRRNYVANGNLEGVLAVKAEAERVQANRDTAEAAKNALPAPLMSRRNQYESILAQTIADLHRQQFEQQQRYVRELESLQAQLTQRNRIDDAIAVKVEKERVLSEMKDTVPRSPVAATAPPQLPGLGNLRMPRGLILHYSFNQRATGDITDETGKNPPGQLSGGAMLADGKKENGLSLGKKSSYMTFPDKNLPRWETPRGQLPCGSKPRDKVIAKYCSSMASVGQEMLCIF
jgi:hypothetical protein